MIFKIKKVEPPYTQVHNNIIDNPALSGKAKWILIYLLSKPSDWQVYESDIINHCTNGRDSIRSGIKELMEVGHIIRGERLRNDKGQLKEYPYEVYEIPQPLTYVGFSNVGKPAHSNINRSKHENVVNLGPEWDRMEQREDEAENYEHDRMTGIGITPL